MFRVATVRVQDVDRHFVPLVIPKSDEESFQVIAAAQGDVDRPATQLRPDGSGHHGKAAVVPFGTIVFRDAENRARILLFEKPSKAPAGAGNAVGRAKSAGVTDVEGFEPPAS
ncbi:hypothetical protein AB3662_12235 [Sorangium cellulosum]|uniref:hypothetical protein n=1 Tax=Sorangium cellulosum TaxID=56 RepID=UPI003D9A24AE